MATLNDFLTARNTAGARYAAAVTELRSALIDLAAIDQVLMNASVGLPAVQQPVRTFHGIPQTMGNSFVHPVYASSVAQNIHEGIAAAAAAKLASFTEV